VTETSLPALNCYDGGSRSDNIEGEAITKSEANAVINLKEKLYQL